MLIQNWTWSLLSITFLALVTIEVRRKSLLMASKLSWVPCIAYPKVIDFISEFFTFFFRFFFSWKTSSMHTFQKVHFCTLHTVSHLLNTNYSKSVLFPFPFSMHFTNHVKCITNQARNNVGFKLKFIPSYPNWTIGARIVIESLLFANEHFLWVESRRCTELYSSNCILLEFETRALIHFVEAYFTM